MDDLRRSYRRIDLVFSLPPAEDEFRIPGVEQVQTRGHQMSVVASKNTEEVIARAQSFRPSSIDVTPVGLREIFLERAKEN